MKSIILILFAFVIHTTAISQITISLNEYDVGDYLGIKYKSSSSDDFTQQAILCEQPDINSKIIDTIKDNYSNLVFKVIETNSKNNFVHVRVVRDNGSNGELENGMIVLPSSISYGKDGWVNKSELEKHPVPDNFMLASYESYEDLLQIIIDNCEWTKYNDSTEYKSLKNKHSKLFLMLGQKYYKRDSMTKAIYFTSNSIKIKPNKTAYIVRALAKIKLEDYQGVISDCSKCLTLKTKPDFETFGYDLKFDGTNVQGIRGYCYLKLSNYEKALVDFNAAIKEDASDGQYFYFRAITKFNLNQKISACDDLSKAGELGFEAAYESIKQYCN